jgi:hypothetical protein
LKLLEKRGREQNRKIASIERELKLAEIKDKNVKKDVFRGNFTDHTSFFFKKKLIILLKIYLFAQLIHTWRFSKKRLKKQMR